MMRGAHQIQRDFDLENHGNDDQTESPAAMLADHRISLHREVIYLVALAGARPPDRENGRYGLRVLQPADEESSTAVIGVARFVLPLLDNLTQVDDISIQVRADWRRVGLGRVLAAAVEHVARRRDRSVLLGYVDSVAAETPDALRPRDGEFGIARSPATEFASAMGYRLVQTERHSIQYLAEYQAVPMSPPDGYRLISWLGPTPDEHLDHVAQLQQAMSTDIPWGEVHYEQEVWDAARVRALDANVAQSSQMLTTLVIDEANNVAAGFTQFNRLLDKPEVVNQWNTLVAADHRGRGLGLLLKRANLNELVTAWPEAQRVHTWNAAENDHMWAINQELGYRTENIDSAWQKQLA